MNPEIINERKSFMTTLSIIQDYLISDNVPLALSVTNEKLKQLGMKQTMAMITPTQIVK